MSFVTPLFLAGAATAIVPIVLHLLKRRTDRRVRFAAVALLRDAPVEHSARRQLRQWLLLALRVAALVLLAFAFARPFYASAPAAGGQLTVVALDTSLSMSAPATRTRARQLALDAVRNAPAGDIAVTTFADRSTVVMPPAPSRTDAFAAVEAATPGFGSTNYRAALATASELFRDRTGTLVVVTDLQATGWDGSDRARLPEAMRVDVEDAGSVADNLAVTDVRTDADRVIATIANAGARARTTRVALAVDGTQNASLAVEIPPHGVAQADFANVRATGVARVSVDDPGGIAGDNARFAFVGGSAASSVLVETTTGDLDRDAWYVRHALNAGTPRSGAPTVTGVAAKDLGTWTGNRLSQFAAVVVLSSRGLERRAREQLAAYLAAGGGVLIAAGDDVDGDVVSDLFGSGQQLDVAAAAAREWSLAPADVRHPIFRAFGDDVSALMSVRFRSEARVAGPGCRTIARFTSGDAAVLDCAVGAGRAVVFASDLNGRWNDFPTRASFVPFLDETIRYVSNGRASGAEYLIAGAPAGVAPVPGPAVADAASGSRRVILNVDPRETDLGRMSVADFQASIDRVKDATVRDASARRDAEADRQHVFQYIAAAAAIALFVEGALAARGV